MILGSFSSKSNHLVCIGGPGVRHEIGTQVSVVSYKGHVSKIKLNHKSKPMGNSVHHTAAIY